MSVDTISPAPSSIPAAPQRPSPRAFLIVAGLVALVAASIPYLIGYYGTKRGVYLWAGTSPSDFGVYLAWMRAAADGSVRDPHLFAGGHPGMMINPVYWVLGIVCRLTRLSNIAVYHLARIVSGAALLWVLWRFVRLCTSDVLVRRLAFLFLCFSSGFGWCLGWLPLKWWSIDRWQPEAFTFLSLYSYPHVCLSLILQVAIVGLLLKSLLTGRLPYAAWAGVCGSLLSIIHTYDILSLALVWLVYILAPRTAGSVDAFPRRRIITSTVVAALLTAPGFAVMYWELMSDRVFAARVAYPTPSFPLYTVLIGYGGILLLAIAGARLLFQARSADPSTPPVDIAHREVGLLLSIWAVMNVVAAYLPVSFQRKMLQGEHVPLCLLAAFAAAWLLRRRIPNADWSRLRLSEVAMAGFLAVGSVFYLYHDTRGILTGTVQRQYRSTLLPGEVDALKWVDRNTARDAVVQPLPWVNFDRAGAPHVSDVTMPLYEPGLTGRSEYAGHWDETPDFDARTAELVDLAFGGPSVDRAGILRRSRIAYLIFSQTHDPTVSAAFARTPGLHLRPVYANADAVVYAVDAK